MKCSCVLHYDTQLLRVEGWSQVTILSNKLNVKSQEDKQLFFRERKEFIHMKYILKELSPLHSRKISTNE